MILWEKSASREVAKNILSNFGGGRKRFGSGSCSVHNGSLLLIVRTLFVLGS